MDKIRLPWKKINKIRQSPSTSGLAFLEYGKYAEINQYSDEEITEMLYGVYSSSKTIKVDDGYFLDLKSIKQTICVLARATYYRSPTSEDLKSNSHNTIRNIRTFYVKDFFLVSEIPVSGQTKHRITQHFSDIKVLRPGRNEFSGLFSIANSYKTLQRFEQGVFPKDLYYPIKRHINGQFFNDDHRIRDFKVESTLSIELGH